MSARSGLIGALVLTVSGCALLNKAEPLDVTYFEPAASPRSSAPPSATAHTTELRLDRVSSAEHLESRIAYREDAVQIGFYEEQRWAERPEAYLRRALARSLFVDRPLAQAVSGARPALEAELLAFEEVRTKDGRRARVSVQLLLHDGPRVLASDVVTVERPVTASGGAGLAWALGRALDDVADRVAERALVGLEEAKPRND